MVRALGILAFLLVGPGAYAAIHYYLWTRLVRDVGMPRSLRVATIAALVVLALLAPLAFIALRTAPRWLAALLAWPAFAWMGFVLLFCFALVGLDLARLGAWAVVRVMGTAAPSDPSRRLLIHRALAGAATAMGGALGGLALWNGARAPVVREIEIVLQRLPRALDGLRIAQLTDLHIGPTLGRGWLESVVDRTNQLAPDLVAITGDLVDETVGRLLDQVRPVASLRAPLGLFFCPGNHEYYAGADEWFAELDRLGLRVLLNRRATVERDGARLDVAGIDDYAGRSVGRGPDLAAALAGRDPATPLLLLAHQPRAIHDAARAGVDLQLSGHTHAGQIWPWGLLVRLQQPFLVGLARVGQTCLYTSPGTGYWGPPMRLGSRSEITLITLRGPSS